MITAITCEKDEDDFSIGYHFKVYFPQLAITAIDHSKWLTHQNGDTTFLYDIK